MNELEAARRTMTDEIGEIIKSGVADKLADLVHKLAGPMADELGQMFGDKVRIYRVQNWVKTLQKTDRILRDAGLSPRAVPPRLLLPIAENSSVEDSESLQEMWAGLLATASQETDAVSPSFIETLKQLTPEEARNLEFVSAVTLEGRKSGQLIEGMQPPPPPYHGIPTPFRLNSQRGALDDVPSGAWGTYERLGLMQRDYEVHAVQDTVGDWEHSATISTQVDYWYSFTEYGVRFMEVCHGPCRHAENDSPKP
jgi:hypothetical protein